MWGRGPRRNNVTCSALSQFSVTSPTTTSKLGPSGADCPVGGLVYVLGPCGSLQRSLLWGWEFPLLVPQPPQVFSISGLRLYFPMLEPWVARSVSPPSCSSLFICMWMWDHLVHNPLPCCVCQPLPCRKTSPPGCLSLPLLPVWMNVSSLSPWLSEFHTVRFSVSFGCFLFLNLLLSFFWLCEEAQCVYLCLHLSQKSPQSAFNSIKYIKIMN